MFTAPAPIRGLLGIEVPVDLACPFPLPLHRLQIPWCTARKSRREGEKGGRREEEEEEEGAGGRRCGGRGPGPGVREAVVEGGGGSELESQPRQGGHFGGARQ